MVALIGLTFTTTLEPTFPRSKGAAEAEEAEEANLSPRAFLATSPTEAAGLTTPLAGSYPSNSREIRRSPFSLAFQLAQHRITRLLVLNSARSATAATLLSLEP